MKAVTGPAIILQGGSSRGRTTASVVPPAQIHAGMLALIADKAADQTAREYASYYTDRDKNQKDMQELDATLIQASCS